MSKDPLPAITELLVAVSPDEAVDVVNRHPELLEDYALELASRLADGADASLKPALNRLVALLFEGRAIGIELAIEKLGFILPPADLTQGLALLTVSDDSNDLREALERYPGLLHEKVEARLIEMEADSSDYSADRLHALLQFLRTCRKKGFEAASCAYEHDVAEVKIASELAAEFVFMDDPNAEAAFLNAHPILLGHQAEKALLALMEMPINSSPKLSTLVEGARRKLETTQRLRAARDASA